MESSATTDEGPGAVGMLPGTENDPNPHHGYAQWLAQGDVVELGPGTKLAASRAAVDVVLKDPELFSSVLGAIPSYGTVDPLIPLNVDPPEHVKYRRILDPLFAPKRMIVLEDRIAARANQYIDTFLDRGECEFHDEFAVPFPSSIFVELMGLPSSDTEVLLAFKNGFMRPSDKEGGREEAVKRNLKAHNEYFNDALDEREIHPTDDILTHILRMEIDGDRLNRREILSICRLFIMAGLDTVTDQLSTSFRDMAESPHLQRRIVDDPSIISNAVEELLRWETVVPMMLRTAMTDTEILGCPIKSGELVMYGMGTANLDPEEFPDPLEIRFDRDANRHLSFGGGIHRCLGSHLARRELRVALREWHRRIPEYRIKPGTELRFPTGLRTVENLVLTWA